MDDDDAIEGEARLADEGDAPTRLPVVYVGEAFDDDPELRQPWEQIPGELDIWYGRFHAFLLLGPTRSVLATARAEKGRRGGTVSAQYWRLVARDWRWSERAREYDAWQNELLRAAQTEERMRAREFRRKLLDDLGLKLAPAIDKLHPMFLTWRDAAAVAKTVTDGLRVEYEGPPNAQIGANGAIDIQLIQQIALAFVKAFQEVNEIGDADARAIAFTERLDQLSTQFSDTGS